MTLYDFCLTNVKIPFLLSRTSNRFRPWPQTLWCVTAELNEMIQYTHCIYLWISWRSSFVLFLLSFRPDISSRRTKAKGNSSVQVWLIYWWSGCWGKLPEVARVSEMFLSGFFFRRMNIMNGSDRAYWGHTESFRNSPSIPYYYRHRAGVPIPGK